MANFDYSTSWASGLQASDNNQYDYKDSEGYYYYMYEGKLYDSNDNLVDADGNIVSPSSSTTSGGGKSGGGFFSGFNISDLLDLGKVYIQSQSGTSASGNIQQPRTSTGGIVPSKTPTPQNPLTNINTQPTVTTNNKWILPVAIGGGVVLVGLIGILVFKKSK